MTNTYEYKLREVTNMLKFCKNPEQKKELQNQRKQLLQELNKENNIHSYFVVL